MVYGFKPQILTLFRIFVHKLYTFSALINNDLGNGRFHLGNGRFHRGNGRGKFVIENVEFIMENLE